MPEERRRPNLILILCDDLGYSDIEPYGGTIPTPALAGMAAEGLVATDAYAPANICTPSRAGFLTGRYAIRSGLAFEVIFQAEDRGLPRTEVTTAAALRPEYASGYFGKWHLGHRGDWMPTAYGFDAFFGIPYSHDMLPLTVFEADREDGSIAEHEPDFALLQQQFFDHALRFIERHRDRPFFVQLALSAPHLPSYPAGHFDGTSQAGPYGDVVREVDAIVGRLLARVRELGLEDDTYVIFTSDNGPWLEGSCAPLRDRKGGAGYDGGFRVPWIAWAPGRIAPGTRTDAIVGGLDVLPTFCALAGRQPPPIEIDGRDISGVLLRGERSPHEEILLFNNEDIVGVRTQEWKYVTHAYYRGLNFNMERAGYPQLYDMRRDVSESYSVAARHPGVLADMQRRLADARACFDPMKKGTPEFFRQLAASGRFRRQD